MNIAIPGVQIENCISEFADISVYRGRTTERDDKRIIKVARFTSACSEIILKLEHEYQILQSLNINKVPRCYDFHHLNDGVALIIEDKGECSLQEELQKREDIDLIAGLRLGLELVEIIGSIHSRNIIHKDINPSNIVCSTKMTDCAIVDFGNATYFSRERAGFLAVPDIKGTLAYMAPEQTGRMNREMDYRADYYSLGVTLYEVFTGVRPFESNDPLTLLHSHIAITPKPAYKQNPRVPEHISAVLSKLLSKSADERYQSVEGIRADLQICLEKVRSGDSASFAVGRADRIGIFHLPQKLYGRTTEKKKVFESFRSIESGGSGVLLIGGLSGTGKTALVQETHPEITRCGGLYCAGKFDQLGRNTPYSALVHACDQLLLTTDAKSESWKKMLASALGHSAQLMVDFLPALKPFVVCEPIQALGPVETQNRFKYVFANFIKIFCKPEHPVVLFLDDLQWMDLGTLRLLEHIISDTDLEYFLLVGCFRSNELHETHPLRDVMKGWGAQGVNFTRLDLTPLCKNGVADMLSDVFSLQSCDLDDFTEFILNRTGGNPFFLRQYLSKLYQEGRVWFDKNIKQWQVDINTLEKESSSDAIVEFMVRQLEKLPEHTRRALNGASCIGNEFDIPMLALALGEVSSQVHTNLFAAVDAGLLVPDLSSRMSVTEKEGVDGPVMTIYRSYRFQHDRVQQAAYSLDLMKKQTVHLRLGQKLLDEFSVHSEPEYLFTLVAHLNESGIEKESDFKKEELFQLNIDAAKIAVKATSYEAAFVYLQKGLKLHPKKDWPDNRDKSFRLCSLMAEVHYLLGSHEEAIEWMDSSLELSLNSLEKASVYNQKLTQLGLVGKYWDSLKTAFIALELLGIDINYQNPGEAIDVVFEELSALVNVDNIQKIYDRPVIKNAEVEYGLKIIAEVMSVAYAVDKRVFVLINLTSVLTALKHGLCADAAPAFSCTGLLHIAMFNKPELGIAYGELGKKLADRFEDIGPRSKAYDWYCNFVVPWAHPLSRTEPLNREAFNLALETGDLPFAGFIANHRAYNTYYMGLPLGQVLDESKRYLQFCNRILHNYAFDCIQGIIWTIDYLQREEGDMSNLPSGQEEFLSRARAPESPFPVGRYLILLIQVHVLEGNAEKAWELAQATENLHEHVAGTISSAEYRYYRILSGLLYCVCLVGQEQQELLNQLKEDSVFFTEWAERNPHTFSHKDHLIKAEIAVLEGQVADALCHFDLAIDSSRKNNFAHEEALACERAAQFWKIQGRLRLALPYAREAYAAYGKWGCRRRMAVLKAQYPGLLKVTSQVDAEIIRSGDSRQYSHRDIGLDELLRSVAVISEARNLNQLNNRALQLLMEGGGADIGALFIGIDTAPLLTTYGRVEDQKIRVESPDPISALQACDKYSIPIDLINAVQAGLEPVILNSYDDIRELLPKERDMIQSDFRETFPKSMVCHPVLRQGKLFGLVYLGNTVTEHAFTHDRLQIMKALAGQLSVSIENVMVYEDLEHLVLKRTKALETANSELKRLSNIDGLTRLYNRRYFDQALDMEIDRAHRSNSSLSLLMCDIDYFKNFNDYYGHVAGDQCIRTIADTLLKNCQRTTDIAARYGGEEFVVILPNTTNEQAMAVANRIQQSIAQQKILHLGSKAKDIVSLSIGIASLIPEHGCVPQQFVCYADEALYESKKNGRDRISVKKF